MPNHGGSKASLLPTAFCRFKGRTVLPSKAEGKDEISRSLWCVCRAIPCLAGCIGDGCLLFQLAVKLLHFIGRSVIFIPSATTALKPIVDTCRSRGRKIKGHRKFIQWCFFIFYKANYTWAPCRVSFFPLSIIFKEESAYDSLRIAPAWTQMVGITPHWALTFKSLPFLFKVSLLWQVDWLLSLTFINVFFSSWSITCALDHVSKLQQNRFQIEKLKPFPLFSPFLLPQSTRRHWRI